MGEGKEEQLSWARPGEGILGLRMGGLSGAIYIAHDWGGGPGDADGGWVVLAMSWGRRPQLQAPYQTWRTDAARGNRGRDSRKGCLS